jgi:hypothetical protein
MHGSLGNSASSEVLHCRNGNSLHDEQPGKP